MLSSDIIGRRIRLPCPLTIILGTAVSTCTANTALSLLYAEADRPPPALCPTHNFVTRHSCSLATSFDMPDDTETDAIGAETTDNNPETGTGRGATDTTDTVVPLPPSDVPNSTGTGSKNSGTDMNDSGTCAEPGATSSKDTIAQLYDSEANSNDTGTTAKGPEPGANATKSEAKETLNIQTAPPNEEAAFNERQPGADKIKRRDDQPKRRPTKCGCLCEPNCNCKCTCAYKGHCVCRIPCEGKCGTRVSRNLVVSLDGTSNQFGPNVSGHLRPRSTFLH
jgi:hypothetical protein